MKDLSTFNKKFREAIGNFNEEVITDLKNKKIDDNTYEMFINFRDQTIYLLNDLKDLFLDYHD